MILLVKSLPSVRFRWEKKSWVENGWGIKKIRSIELTRRPKKQRNKNSDVFPFQKKGTKMESFQVGGSCSRGGGRQQRNRISNSLPFEQFRQLAGALKRTEVESRTWTQFFTQKKERYKMAVGASFFYKNFCVYYVRRYTYRFPKFSKRLFLSQLFSSKRQCCIFVPLAR